MNTRIPDIQQAETTIFIKNNILTFLWCIQ
jgi:hypothetical protein